MPLIDDFATIAADMAKLKGEKSEAVQDRVYRSWAEAMAAGILAHPPIVEAATGEPYDTAPFEYIAPDYDGS